MTNDWQLLVVKIQGSGIYAEFGPCYSEVVLATFFSNPYAQSLSNAMPFF